MERPEDLPPHLRTKTYTRRKTQDAFAPTGTLMPKPSTQSPAPGSASSPGPSQRGQGRSATPSGMPRTASTGNAPSSNAFASGVMGGSNNGESHFDNDYASTNPVGFAANAPSPMFSPAQEQGPMLSAGLGEGTGGADPSFPTFRSSLGMDADDDIRNGLAGAEHADVGASPGPPPHTSEYDNMFMEMGDPDREGDADRLPGNEPVANLEHETSHASEALEMMASNEQRQDDDVGLEDGEAVGKEFDEFLTGDGEHD